MLLEHMFMFLYKKLRVFYFLFFDFFTKTGAYELGSRKTLSSKTTLIRKKKKL
jgi:hypothetical protein